MPADGFTCVPGPRLGGRGDGGTCLASSNPRGVAYTAAGPARTRVPKPARREDAMTFTRLIALLWTLTLATACQAQDAGPGTSGGPAAPGTAEDPYRYTVASPHGIGKIYMGREIAQVMGHRGWRWLERPERAAEERPDLFLARLDLGRDAVVADIGAGSGYHTFRLAALVPDGAVLAVDIQQEMLDLIVERAAREGADNVTPVLGTITDPNLPEGKVDAVLMVDAYHEFSHPAEMLAGIYRGLKPGGRVYLLEFRAEDPRVPILALHKMTKSQARRELEANGFTWLQTIDDLPWQHLLVFEK